MPVHDWTRVDAGIFHAFHHDWITEIARALNRGILPNDYYALPEQFAAGFGPDVLALHGDAEPAPEDRPIRQTENVALAPPKLRAVAETQMAFYRRRQMAVAVRHVTGDRIVAMVEIVSPGNKSSRHAIRSLVEKAAELLERGIHLLIVDVHPPGRRDPQGIHAEIWEEVAGEEQTAPHAKPLTLAAYASGLSVRAYVVSLAVGEPLSDMPLFLESEKAVEVPLEATYSAAFSETPRRWRHILESPS